MYSIADLKPGHAIELEGVPYLVLAAKFSRKSQGKPNCATKVKNLKTGAIVQRTFIGSEKVSPADVGYRHVQYLYTSTGLSTGRNGKLFMFMDLNTYDQFELSAEVVGDGKDYLTEGLELDVLVFGEKPIALKLPVTVDLRVTETTPGVRGDTATGGTKVATLETDLKLQVPLFIREGDTVRVNTERGEYVERV